MRRRTVGPSGRPIVWPVAGTWPSCASSPCVRLLRDRGKAAKLADQGWGINARTREKRARAQRAARHGTEQVLRDGARLERDRTRDRGTVERTGREPGEQPRRRGGERPHDLAGRHAASAREAAALDHQERGVGAPEVDAAAATSIERRLVAARGEQMELEGAEQRLDGCPAVEEGQRLVEQPV